MESGAKNIIPQWVAYSESPVVFLVMMQHVMLLDALPERMAPPEVMHGIVHHIVAQIADQESGEKRIDSRLAYQRLKAEEEQECKRNAYARWHDESKPVVRVVVVHAVPDEVQALAPFARRYPMKKKTVQNVFGQRPYEEAGQKQYGQVCPATVPLPQQPTYDRNINDQRHSEMHFRQGFHPAGPEHPDGFG